MDAMFRYCVRCQKYVRAAEDCSANHGEDILNLFSQPPQSHGGAGTKAGPPFVYYSNEEERAHDDWLREQEAIKRERLDRLRRERKERGKRVARVR